MGNMFPNLESSPGGLEDLLKSLDAAWPLFPHAAEYSYLAAQRNKESRCKHSPTSLMEVITVMPAIAADWGGGLYQIDQEVVEIS